MTGPQGPRGYTGAPGTPGQAGPKGDKGDPGTDTWGNITGDISDQTDLQTALNAKANTASLATVATSGSYNDLSNRPAIENLVPYTGATKNINIGYNTLTVGSESSVHAQIMPGSIHIENPQYSSGISPYAFSINGTSIYWPTVSADPNGKYFALKSDITSHAGIDKVGTVTSVNGTSPDSNGNVIIPDSSGWEFLDLVAEKTFQKAFTEVKPGKSGIPSGNATVNVTTTTWQNKIGGVIVGYKTILDVTCRCPQFNLNDVGLSVLLSKVGSRWFFPRMAVSRGNIQSGKFTKMMDRLNAQKDRVGILVDEVSVFRDTTTNLGYLNTNGVITGQIVYDYAEFRVFAVMLELDKDHEGKSIPCTGAHYRIVLYHPETIL